MDIVAIILVVGMLFILEHKHKRNFNRQMEQMYREIEQLEKRVRTLYK